MYTTSFDDIHTFPFYIAFRRLALCPKARINTLVSLPLLAFVQQTTLIARSCGSTLDRVSATRLVNRTPSLSTARSPFCGVHIRRAVCTYLVDARAFLHHRTCFAYVHNSLLSCSIKRENGRGRERRLMAVALYAADL